VISPTPGLDNCAVDGVGLLMIWGFNLPTELSAYDISYRYLAYLSIRPDRTAHFVRRERPDDLIRLAEANPAVREFLEKGAHLDVDDRVQYSVVGPAGNHLDGSNVAAPTVNYWRDGVGTLGVSALGRLESAHLDPRAGGWNTFPSLGIGDAQARSLLDGGPCHFTEPRFVGLAPLWYPAEPVAVEKRIQIECEDTERQVYDPRSRLSIWMYPVEGRYEIRWPSSDRDGPPIASGRMTDLQHDAIQESLMLAPGWDAVP